MHRDDYRRAMRKIQLSQQSRDQLLEAMRAAEQGNAVPFPRRKAPARRWALTAAAAALALAAVPLGIRLAGASGGLTAAGAPSLASAAPADPSEAAPALEEPARDSAAAARDDNSGASRSPEKLQPSEVGQPVAPAAAGQAFAAAGGAADAGAQAPAAGQDAASGMQDAADAAASQPPAETAPDSQNAVQGQAGSSKAAAPAGQVIRLSDTAGGNPTLDLPEEELPARLPVYTATAPDAEEGRAALEKLADALGLQPDSWQQEDGGVCATAGGWTLRYTAEGISVTGRGVLLARGEGVADADLGSDYAARLQALCPGDSFRSERTGGLDADKRPTGDVRLYVAAGDSLSDRLYRYCFETLTLQLDSAGNVAGLTASAPVLTGSVARVQPLKTLSQAREELGLEEGRQVVHHELVYVHGADGASVVPAYKFTVTTGESLAGYFTDGCADGYAAVERLYVPAVADGGSGAPTSSSGQGGAAALPGASLSPAG